ncbi:excinuclease ABC subunit B [Candidatus Roizmanbacteria bacterium RIFOXYD1_FULL_41_24]|nr:MAG: excinuclease ABC subunit B [Candidatus Roizmanbacteria bacterium RIFOXYB1_FULL_41_27]OGK74755.1 MAG: excinuclease ABC subunit B [Candidatus Roizmanbacteria bacterium RIFOXYC2_FULL_41_10]OGK75275.1 MAG: excinuclease ABC subunit B [Candidatus Roizmanbacteria bacterium RIFOXYD1_FULL_41_24]
MQFKLKSTFKPTGDQPQAISKLVDGLNKKYPDQTLLGVTGSGKTFTMANVIAQTQKPTLLISHNKTLAGQLYQEFRDFFPENAVSYFVSYYDFYQPEAYIPSSNTYIEKEAQINELIDKLRLEATSNILSRQDTLVVSSVSCIYNLGKPENYQKHTLTLAVGQPFDFKQFRLKLVQLQYGQNQFDFHRGTFRERGEHLDVYLSYQDLALRIKSEQGIITELKLIDPLTAKTVKVVSEFELYPAKHYLVSGMEVKSIFKEIRTDLDHEVEFLERQKKLVEAQRLSQRVKHDLEMIEELGYVNGIENYSRYFDGRSLGEPPFSLLEYFQYRYGSDWLLLIDESHMTVPQLNGMYHGDYSRKKNLVDYGFRLKAAFDNRPLKFDEFLQKKPLTIYLSATPAPWEKARSKQIVEQLIRPTGITDPKISIRPVDKQIPDLIAEITKRAVKKQRTLVTTLTKRIAEDLAQFLIEKNIRAHYLHSDIKTLERSDILEKLRTGEFDVLIGINLLREGLDLPEVTLVAILDGDREGFLRSRTSLIQTMGRAARNTEGEVIIYTDKMTKSIQEAVEEVSRRRQAQTRYNQKHHLNPTTIIKPIRSRLVVESETDLKFYFGKGKFGLKTLDEIKSEALTVFDKKKLIRHLRSQMKKEADNLNFELAAKLRDKARLLERE